VLAKHKVVGSKPITRSINNSVGESASFLSKDATKR